MKTFNDWKGKWFLVTGGAERVGAEIAEYLAARGLNGIVHARTDRPTLHALKRRVEKEYGVRIKLVTGELTKKADVEAIFAKVSPDVVINNAAVFKPGDARENMAANKHAPLLVAKAAVARMRADKKGGVIFFVGDAFLAKDGMYSKELSGYSRSKAWIPGEVRRLAKLNREGIRVLAVLNGPIEPPKTASRKAITAIRSELNMPAKELNPWIGGKKVGEAIYGLLLASAIVGESVLVDGGRKTVRRVPKEH